MDYFDLIYYITFLFIPIAPYFLFFKQSSNRFYQNREWNYIFKLILAKSSVKRYQNKCASQMDNNNENSVKIQSDSDSDSQYIYGLDQEGNSLSLKFSIQSGLVGEVFLCLRLGNKAIYTFPGGDASRFYSLSSNDWKTKDLRIEILEPFKRLRILFNGLLANADRNIQHVQFNFIWTAACAPQFYPQDADNNLLSDALARCPWKDGNWLSLIGEDRGYEQFGALKGFIKGDAFSDDLKLNLPSCRTRFWTNKLAKNKILRLFVAAQDGALVNLWIKNFKNGCKMLQHGHVITNSGEIRPITNSDVGLDFNQSFPSIFKIQFQSKNQIYSTVFHSNLNKLMTSPQMSNLPADCDINTQQGKALIEFYNGEKNKSSEKSQPLITVNKSDVLPNCYVTAFSDESAKVVRLTGGKGSSLALLTSLTSDKFSVPDGFIVTVNAFNHHLESNFKIKKAVSILDDICCERIKGDLLEACSETVKIIQNEEIRPEIRKQIFIAFENVKKLPIKESWAVRSSAIGEDSEELSAAGQNETFLGCNNYDDVINAISSCWASLYTFQSVRYRHQHGLPIISQMAVVVQQLIPADCAGVLFTHHPSTSNSAHLIITANHGLGESVVSGRSEPDTILLQRTFDGDITIKSKSIGSKKTMIKIMEKGVTEVQGIDDFSITDNQALALGRVGVFLEEKLGGARDIEWGYYQNQLFLFQSRPITTLFSWSNYELSHEFDIAVLSDDVVYTIANTGEILPGAISPLTFSTIVKHLDLAIQESIGLKLDYKAFKALATFQHHLFIDVVNGIHKRVDKTINLLPKCLDLAIFGHPIINEKIHSLSVMRNGYTSNFTKIKEFFTTIKLAINNEKTTLRSKNLAKLEIPIDKQRDTIKDIYTKIEKSLDVFQQLALLHCFTTRTSVTYQILALNSLAENSDDFNVDHYNDAAMLLASCDEVISAEIPNTLANITQVLNKNHQIEELCKIDPDKGFDWLKYNAKDAADIFKCFIETHGHRGYGEFDFINQPWSCDSTQLIKMLQANCKSTQTKQKVVKTTDEVIANLKTPKKASTKKFLKFIINRSRKAVGLREQTKSETIRFVNKLRNAYKFLSEKMTQAGLIPSQDLIYHLTHYEIGQIIGGAERNPVLITKALKRQKLFAKWNLLKFPEISYGIPRYENRDFIPRSGDSKVRCVGTPVCNGVIQSRACVITDLSEIDQLQEGDVLITYCTDIGWSPYFPMLGGIVTELGGLVSHGAVIAREYGLPCIVGAKGSTKLFKTGDIILLSGKTGTIELIAE